MKLKAPAQLAEVSRGSSFMSSPPPHTHTHSPCSPLQPTQVLEISRRLIAAHYKPRTRDSSPHARSPRLEQVASADNPHRRRARSASDGSHDGTTSATSAGAGSGAGAGEGGKTTSGWWSSGDESNDEQEQLYKLLQIQDILGGEVFHGINRKVIKHTHPFQRHPAT